jgi:hypothetical protein
MAREILNTLRGTTVVRLVDPGVYTVNLTDLRANTTTETVSAYDIKRLYWSTNGSISIIRNGELIITLHNTGEMRLDDWGYVIANNRTANANVIVTTGGTLIMELNKEATYNVDPYTG